MSAEYESEVTVQEDFGGYTTRMKFDIIIDIIRGRCVDFDGYDTITIDPPDYY